MAYIIRNNKTGETKVVGQGDLPKFGLNAPQATPSATPTPTKPQVPQGQDPLTRTMQGAGNELSSMASGLPKLFDNLVLKSNPANAIFDPKGYAQATTENAKMAVNLPISIVKDYVDMFTSPFNEKDRFGFMQDKPITTLTNILPLLKIGKLFGMGAKASEATKVASEIGKVGEGSSKLGASANLARNVISPDIASDAIGTLSKEEQISKNVLDITKGITKHGIAKDIEKIYAKVNSQLDKLLSSPEAGTNLKTTLKDTTAGPSTVDPNTVIDNLTSSMVEDPMVRMRPDIWKQVSQYINDKLAASGKTTAGPDALLNQTGPIPGKVPMYTVNPKTIHDVRVGINKDLNKWYAHGAPTATDTDLFNGMLSSANEKLGEILSGSSPEARELINVQANLIPANKGLLKKLNPSKSPVSSQQIPGYFSRLLADLANLALDPAQIKVARNAKSPFSTRLQELLGETAPSAVQSTGGIPKLWLPTLLNELSQGTQK